MNDLEKFFRQNDSNLIHKWLHYFEAYDRHFARYRGTDVHLIEFGVSHGGSLNMWRDYFGPKVKIWGVDINPDCAQFSRDGVEIFIGDQADREFLERIKAEVPRIDILIDDGGHTMEQQQATFEVLFDKIEPNGIYLCEDMHTSYWKSHEGGYKRPSSFIEYTKDFIDKINAWHSEEPDRLAPDDFTRSVSSLHYYDSILVVEKRPMTAPEHQQTGQRVVTEFKPKAGVRGWIEKKLKGAGKT